MDVEHREAGLAALNAVLGDRLARQRSPLATSMALFDRGRRLEALPERTRRLVVLVHGMACTERCWSFSEEPDTDYGRLLRAEHGFTPLYVRYNTGRSIWENGQDLALLLAGIEAGAPEPVEDMILIGHSLGGLVLRSACHHGQGSRWLSRVSRAFYLGSPHRGSPWERLGRVTTRLLRGIPDPVTRLVGEVVDLRSVAVKSLGEGRLTETGEAVPLAPDVEHHFVAGAVASELLARWVGDGLVPFASATELARSADSLGSFPGIAHMTLARNAQVYRWIAERVAATTPAPRAEVPRPERTPPAIVDGPPEGREIAGIVALVAEGVEAGASAIGQVHEALAARPYAVLEALPGIDAPTRVVRKVHFGLLRGTYGAVKWVGARVKDVSVAAGAQDQAATSRGAIK